MANQNRHPFQPQFMQPVGTTNLAPPYHGVSMGIVPQQPGMMVNTSAFHGVRPGMWAQQMAPVARKPVPNQRWPQGGSREWKEQQQKEREYLKQQQKLRTMASFKKEPVTADALIENMFGKKEYVKPKNQQPQTVNNEFPAGRITDTQDKRSIDLGEKKNEDGVTFSTSCTNNTNIGVGNMIPSTGAKNEVQLDNLMLACSDLKSTGRAKTFAKPSVRDIKVSKPSGSISYTPSQKACDWSRVDNMSSVFNIMSRSPAGVVASQDGFAVGPQPVHPYPATQAQSHMASATSPPVTPPANQVPTSPPPVGLPVWITSKPHVPPAYQQMWEHVKDSAGMVDTTRIFSLLLTTGLPREVLGYIWSLANQKVPGQLTEEELYVVLALVGLVQAGCQFNNRSVLNLVPQAPLPKFNVCVPQAAPSDTPAAEPQVPSATQPTDPPRKQAIVVAPPKENAPPGEDDEFTDFQSADPSVPAAAAGSNQPSRSDEDQSPPSSASDTFHNPIYQESPPTSPSLSSSTSSPVILPRYQNSNGRSIGSRLANYNVGTPKASDKRQANHVEDLSSKSNETQDDDDDFCDFQQASVTNSNESAVYLKQELEKQSRKHFPKTFVLKESVIRSVPPPIVKSSVNEVQVQVNDSMLMEDKYSALRELSLLSDSTKASDISDLSSVDADGKDSMEDDGFGDFVTAPSNDSFAEIAKDRILTSKPGPTVSVPTISCDFSASVFTVNSEPAQEWHADFGSVNLSADPNSQPPHNLGNLGNKMPWNGLPVSADDMGAKDDDDFGEFVGPETLPKEPNVPCEVSVIHKLRDLSPEQQSVSSLEFGGFDNLSIGEGRLDNLSIGDGQLTLSRQGSLPSLDLNVFGVGATEEDAGDSGSAQGPTLPVPSVVPLVAEKYSIEPWDTAQGGDRHAYEWHRCLQSCLNLLQAAYDIFGSISSNDVVEEVVSTGEGKDYLSNLLEVYCVSQRIRLSCKQLGTDARLGKLLSDINCIWENLKPFYDRSEIEVTTGMSKMASTSKFCYPRYPTEEEMEELLTTNGLVGEDSAQSILPQEYIFSSERVDIVDSAVQGEAQDAILQENACGVCLVSVEFSNSQEKAHQLAYSGRLYHSTCANLWVNCVDSLLPSLPSISLL